MRHILAAHALLRRSAAYPLLFCSAFALALMVLRNRLAADNVYRFMAWNLFLAWIPYGFSLLLGALRSRALIAACTLIWLAFFPNAFYLVTDLVHFRYNTDFIWWYDLGMLAAFACAGMLLAVSSLRLVHAQVRRRTSAAVGWAFVLAVAGLSGIGIYVGRFLRWNSWDVITNPQALAADLAQQLQAPELYPRMVGVTGLFAGLLLFAYLTLAAFAPVGQPDAGPETRPLS